MTMVQTRRSGFEPEQLQGWVGSRQTSEDLITAAPVLAMAATMERDVAAHVGAELSPLWHWLYFLPLTRQSELGRDGHSRTGGFLPLLPLPRRMWAGGRVVWHAPLHVGQAVQRTSCIQAITHKQGRQGDLVFVTVLHEIYGQDGLAISEEQDLVYRDAPTSPQALAAGQPAPGAVLSGHDLFPDEALLFRYSALTFNTHRIHYDLPYATREEGYPALVVHGPLQATLLAGMAAQQPPTGALTHFEFRAVRPAFQGKLLGLRAGAVTSGGKLELWTQDEQAFVTMQATARLKSKEGFSL
jgi:3-methylfumaryl-CoA hydratase